MRAVVDTNVIVVANKAHEGVSPACVIACINRLQALMRDGRVVIDDDFGIVREYLRNTMPVKGAKKVGDVFVHWLLQNRANPRHVEAVSLDVAESHGYRDIADSALHDEIDPPDRKFLAAAFPRREPPALP